MTLREILLAWAKSEGFAAIHNGKVTDEQIVDDLIQYLRRQPNPLSDIIDDMSRYRENWQYFNMMTIHREIIKKWMKDLKEFI